LHHLSRLLRHHELAPLTTMAQGCHCARYLHKHLRYSDVVGDCTSSCICWCDHHSPHLHQQASHCSYYFRKSCPTKNRTLWLLPLCLHAFFGRIAATTFRNAMDSLDRIPDISCGALVDIAGPYGVSMLGGRVRYNAVAVKEARVARNCSKRTARL